MTNSSTAVFGERVRQLRQTEKLSQQALAERLGVKRSTVTGIEINRDAPSLELVIALADYFKVPIDYLFGCETPPGGPLPIRVAYGLSEVALVDFWRNRSIEERYEIVRKLGVSIPAVSPGLAPAAPFQKRVRPKPDGRRSHHS